MNFFPRTKTGLSMMRCDVKNAIKFVFFVQNYVFLIKLDFLLVFN